MKLSKFVKRAKSESYCVVIHADDSGIWLGTRLALYNATELPYMEGKEQAGAVLDIDSKAWEKMFFDEKFIEAQELEKAQLTFDDLFPEAPGGCLCGAPCGCYDG